MTAETRRITIYLIHAAVDRRLADFLKAQVEARLAGSVVFMASKAGEIPPGTDWRTEISKQLRAADWFITLLTPTSISRAWVWYESGVAWYSERRNFPVVAGGVEKGGVPEPVGSLQALDLEEPEDASHFFAELGTTLEEPADFCRTVSRLARESVAPTIDEGWQSVKFLGAYFAWDGPLHSLEDRDPIQPPFGLENELQKKGMTPSYGNRGNQGLFRKGRSQVFATDQREWKREVLNGGGQVLLVRPSQPNPLAGETARLAKLQYHSLEPDARRAIRHLLLAGESTEQQIANTIHMNTTNLLRDIAAATQLIERAQQIPARENVVIGYRGPYRVNPTFRTALEELVAGDEQL